MSQVDRFVGFAFTHQTLIFEGIVAITLAVIVLWLFSSLQKEQEPDNSAAVSRDVEAALKRILALSVPPAPGTQAQAQADKILAGAADPLAAKSAIASVLPGATATAPAPAPPAAPSMVASVAAPQAGGGPAVPKPVIIETPDDSAQPAPAQAAAPAQEKQVTAPPASAGSQSVPPQFNTGEMEKELERTRDELRRLRETASNAGAGNQQLIEDLKKQIQNLEGRLREYAIIEDDIANLSLYKEENTKLKSELEKLRGQGARAAASPAVTAAATAAPQFVEPKDEPEPAISAPIAAPAAAPIAAQPVVEKVFPPAAPIKGETLGMSPIKPGAAPMVNAPVLDYEREQKKIYDDPEIQKEIRESTTEKLPSDPGDPKWPINDKESKLLIQEFDGLLGAQTPASATNEIIDHSNAKEGEKLIVDFQNFMKGAR